MLWSGHIPSFGQRSSTARCGWPSRPPVPFKSGDGILRMVSVEAHKPEGDQWFYEDLLATSRFRRDRFRIRRTPHVPERTIEHPAQLALRCLR